MTPVPSAPNRPIDHADVIIGAPYIEGNKVRQHPFSYSTIDAGFIAAADNYALGTPSGIAAAFAYVDADIRNVGGGVTPGVSTLSEMVNGHLTRWNNAAASYGKTFICYEGALAVLGPDRAHCVSNGLSAGTPAGKTYADKFYNLVMAYKRSSMGQQLLKDLYDAMLAKSSSQMPSQYLTWSAASTSEEDAPWSYVVGSLYATPSGPFDTICAYNAVSNPGKYGLRPYRYRGTSCATLFTVA